MFRPKPCLCVASRRPFSVVSGEGAEKKEVSDDGEVQLVGPRTSVDFRGTVIIFVRGGEVDGGRREEGGGRRAEGWLFGFGR